MTCRSSLKLHKWNAFLAPLPTEQQKHRVIIYYVYSNKCKFFYITSQVEKAKFRSRNDLSSLVEISPDEWPKVITKNSCIECRKHMSGEISIEEFMKMYEKGLLKALGVIPDRVKKKIISGICFSNTYTDTEKSKFVID